MISIARLPCSFLCFDLLCSALLPRLLQPLADGTYEVGVHIADVSHFLDQGTALDEEASLRATSTYLVQRVIPMLPSLLCEELCSLNPGVDRLAFSVLWRMNADGELLPGCEPFFCRSVIRS